MGRRSSKFKSDRLRFYEMIEDLYVKNDIEINLSNSFSNDTFDCLKQHFMLINGVHVGTAFNNYGKQINKIEFYIKNDINRIESIIFSYGFYLLPSSCVSGVYYLVLGYDI